MKKILESELMSIAHSILKLKGREDIEKMYLEAQKLYEKISILRYYEKNNLLNLEEISIEKLVTSVTFNNTLENVDNEDFENINNVILEEHLFEEIEKQDENVINETSKNNVEREEKKVDEETKIVTEELTPKIEEKHEDKIIDLKNEKEEFNNKEENIYNNENKEINVNEIKEYEKNEEAVVEIKTEVDKNKHSKIEDYLGDNYDDLEFIVKKKLTVVEEVGDFKTHKPIVEEKTVDLFSKDKVEEPLKLEEPKQEKREEKSKFEDLDLIKRIVEEAQQKVDAIKSERNLSLNDTVLKGLNIGLNDRIGFVKHLFNGSNEDYNRVISQLSTIETFEEAHLFINIHVKPDYNKWEGKEDYEIRFLNIIEKKYL